MGTVTFYVPFDPKREGNFLADGQRLVELQGRCGNNAQISIEGHNVKVRFPTDYLGLSHKKTAIDKISRDIHELFKIWPWIDDGIGPKIRPVEVTSDKVVITVYDGGAYDLTFRRLNKGVLKVTSRKKWDPDVYPYLSCHHFEKVRYQVYELMEKARVSQQEAQRDLFAVT